MKLILTGHYAGKTVTLNGYKFENGELDVGSDLTKIDNIVRYFASYNAFLAGSPELAEAQERDRINKETNHGASEILDGQNGPQSGGVSTDKPGTSEAGSGGAGDSETNYSGSVSAGSGVSAGRVAVELSTDDPKMLMIIDALKALDPTSDEHWTDAGLPRVDAVAEASKVADVTRTDIEKAIPGWTRQAALAAV